MSVEAWGSIAYLLGDRERNAIVELTELGNLGVGSGLLRFELMSY